jgi:hypothetical protein
LPSLRSMCVHRMCKLSVLTWVVRVLFVGTLTVWFLAPAEAQEISYLEGAACAQYGQCGGGSGTDPGVPPLAPVSASAPAWPPPSSVTPDTEEDDSDRLDRSHRKYGAKDETKVGKDAKQGARDATDALGRAREGEHKGGENKTEEHMGGENRTEAESGRLGLAENFVGLGLWSASEEDVAATGPQVAPSEPAEAAPVTDTVVEDGEATLTEAAEGSDGSAEVNLAKADNGETQYVREVVSVKWMDSDFMESGMEGADSGKLDTEPDGNGVETAEGDFSGSASESNVAQVSKSDGPPPDLAVAGLGPVDVNTESRHGGATLVAVAVSLLVATALGVLAMIVRRRRAG